MNQRLNESHNHMNQHLNESHNQQNRQNGIFDNHNFMNNSVGPRMIDLDNSMINTNHRGNLNVGQNRENQKMVDSLSRVLFDAYDEDHDGKVLKSNLFIFLKRK